MKSVCVLGAGMVGSVIARDLARDFNVCVVDRDSRPLNALEKFGCSCRKADVLNNQELSRILEKSDLVVGAVPGFMGQQVLRQVIKSGRDCVDISFFPEDPFELSAEADAAGSRIIVDCGVAPGLSHMLLGCRYEREKVLSYRCLVGGLPLERQLPWQYKAPFSPIDVLEEYTRPARLRRNGHNIELPALSEAEQVDLAPLGTLEAVNTDGLRSLIYSMPVPEMSEKTLRYPGHYDQIRLLSDAGFLSDAPIRVGDTFVKPLELSATLLLPTWELKDTDDECTIMRTELTYPKDGKILLERWDLFDRRDAEGISSMSRTTGYTCSATLRALSENRIERKGLITPEYIGTEDKAFERILVLLAERGIKLSHSVCECIGESDN